MYGKFAVAAAFVLLARKAPEFVWKGFHNMALLNCPKCGQQYSDSYRECPFCLEDDEFYGRRSRRGKRADRPKKPSVMGPAMVLVVLILVGYLGYAFLGGTVADWMDKWKDEPVVEDPLPNEGENEEQNQEDPLPLAAITLDQTSLTLTMKDAAQLVASGAEGITWSSSDAAVATVDETGKVTAVDVGNATITAMADGATSAACVVTVTAPKKDLILQSIYGTRDDISIGVNGGAPMEVIGTDSAVQWSTEDSSVATVDSEGYVKGVGRGNTKVVAKVDGQTLTCIVRVG